MSVIEKLIKKMFSDSAISYKDAETLLLKLGYSLKIRGSHHGFRKDGYANIILKKRTRLLPYQVGEIRKALVEHGYEKE